MPTNRVLPEDIQQMINSLPESSYGAHRVTVILDDGTEISDVYVAWGEEVVKVGDSEDIPFDVSKVVGVKPFARS